jgi:hypothetical protein
MGKAETQPQEKMKIQGTTLWLPKELKDRIKMLSQRYGKAQWKILLDALSLYETQLRKPKTKEDLPMVDKILWYIEKLSMSVGAFKENPSEGNLRRLMNTIGQVRDRLKVDTRLLEKAVTDYSVAVTYNFKDASEKHTAVDESIMELNMALKSVLIEMVYKHILREEAEHK